LCDVVIPLCAGEERAVAATKSFLLAGFAFLQLAAAWTDEPELQETVLRTADALDAACAIDWAPALAPLAAAQSLYVLGRGVGLGAALEVALKLKETCRIHAEAFSTAEVLHGPIALVDRGFPVLALGQHDETADGTRDVIARLVALGGTVTSVLEAAGTVLLPTVSDVPAIVAPLCQVQSFYLALPSLAAARGLDADTPSHLHKVTKTV
jgi:glucosamine--fructose-6-phosphate aminotransferase (isomerizing)